MTASYSFFLQQQVGGLFYESSGRSCDSLFSLGDHSKFAASDTLVSDNVSENDIFLVIF